MGSHSGSGPVDAPGGAAEHEAPEHAAPEPVKRAREERVPAAVLNLPHEEPADDELPGEPTQYLPMTRRELRRLRERQAAEAARAERASWEDDAEAQDRPAASAEAHTPAPQAPTAQPAETQPDQGAEEAAVADDADASSELPASGTVPHKDAWTSGAAQPEAAQPAAPAPEASNVPRAATAQPSAPSAASPVEAAPQVSRPVDEHAPSSPAASAPAHQAPPRSVPSSSEARTAEHFIDDTTGLAPLGGWLAAREEEAVEASVVEEPSQSEAPAAEGRRAGRRRSPRGDDAESRRADGLRRALGGDVEVDGAVDIDRLAADRERVLRDALEMQRTGRLDDSTGMRPSFSSLLGLEQEESGPQVHEQGERREAHKRLENTGLIAPVTEEVSLVVNGDERRRGLPGEAKPLAAQRAHGLDPLEYSAGGVRRARWGTVVVIASVVVAIASVCAALFR